MSFRGRDRAGAAAGDDVPGRDDGADVALDPRARPARSSRVGRRRWKVLGGAVVVLALAGGGAAAYANQQGWLRDTYLAAIRPCPDTSWTVEPGPEPSSAGADAHDGDAQDADAAHVEILDPELTSATDVAFGPDGETAYVVTQEGRVHLWRGDAVVEASVLDLSDSVSTDFDQGLLGAAVDPGGEWLYLLLTDEEGTSQLLAVALGEEGRPRPADQRVLLEVAQPDVYHNGGGLRFGADGMLYASIGDGGLIGDPTDNAQSRGALLGKVLRIEPTPDGDDPYRVPADNPFVDEPGAAPEVWAYGMRNPFRISVDRATGDLWVADVGNNCVEEVTRVAAGAGGANLGWNRWEGTRKFVRDDPADHLPPTFAYPHRDGWCAVTGVSVYRGTDVPDLGGRLLVADICVGAIVAVDLDSGRAVDARRIAGAVGAPIGLVADPAGEVLVLSQVNGIGRLRGGAAPDGDGPPSATAGDDAGARVFAEHCAACHGADGGGNVGPAIGDGRTVERFPDVADQIAVVTEGRNGMPAFGGRLAAEQIAQVVRYVRNGLQGN